jgi:hypothetical protein
LSASGESPFGEDDRAVAVQVRPPQIARHVVANEATRYRLLRRTLTIRYSSNHRVVALFEIVLPSNKDRSASVTDFVEKVCSALKQGIHVLMIDLFPASPHDPERLHGEISYVAGLEDKNHQPLPANKPLALASHIAQRLPEGNVDPWRSDIQCPTCRCFSIPTSMWRLRWKRPTNKLFAESPPCGVRIWINRVERRTPILPPGIFEFVAFL